jgi:hypothetical protein
MLVKIQTNIAGNLDEENVVGFNTFYTAIPNPRWIFKFEDSSRMRRLQDLWASVVEAWEGRTTYELASVTGLHDRKGQLTIYCTCDVDLEFLGVVLREWLKLDSGGTARIEFINEAHGGTDADNNRDKRLQDAQTRADT